MVRHGPSWSDEVDFQCWTVAEQRPPQVAFVSGQLQAGHASAMNQALGEMVWNDTMMHYESLW